MMKKLHLALMLFGFLELLLGVNPAWSQTACGPAFVGNPNFCHVTVSQLLVPPSPPAKVLKPADAANPGYPLHLVFIFLCSDLFDGHLIDCGYSVEVLKAVDSSPNEPNAENGGHIASKHGSAHPLIEPKGSGLFDFAGSPDSTGIVVASPPDPPKIIGNTGKSVAVVLYPVPQASGELFIERFVVSPPRYLCDFPGCFDQVPGRFGLNRMQFLDTLHVGIPIEGPFCPFCPVVPAEFSELIQTADAPFVLTGDKPAHPKNHFGTAIALEPTKNGGRSDRVRPVCEDTRGGDRERRACRRCYGNSVHDRDRMAREFEPLLI